MGFFFRKKETTMVEKINFDKSCEICLENFPNASSGYRVKYYFPSGFEVNSSNKFKYFLQQLIVNPSK